MKKTRTPRQYAAWVKTGADRAQANLMVHRQAHAAVLQIPDGYTRQRNRADQRALRKAAVRNTGYKVYNPRNPHSGKIGIRASKRANGG